MSALADGGGYAVFASYAEYRFQKGTRYMVHRKVSENLRANAKRLRSDMTETEKKLWQAIRAHRLEGIAFRRQLPIAGYIVDFAAPAYRLIVELDGSQYGEERGLLRDKARDEKLAQLGWTVLRIWNSAIREDLDGVCRQILDACGKEQC